MNYTTSLGVGSNGPASFVPDSSADVSPKFPYIKETFLQDWQTVPIQYEQRDLLDRSIGIDTIRLYLHQEDFIVEDKNALEVRYKRQSTNRPLWSLSTGEIVYGSYAQVLFGTKSKWPRQKELPEPHTITGPVAVKVLPRRRKSGNCHGTGCLIEFSVPHVYWEYDNFVPVGSREIKAVLLWIQNLLRLFGIRVTDEGILNAKVSRLDLFRNIQLSESPVNYLDLLDAAYKDARKGRRESHGIYHGGRDTSVFYDKSSHMKHLGFVSGNFPENVMRHEIRLSRRKIKQELKIDTLADLFRNYDSLESFFLRASYNLYFKTEVPTVPQSWQEPYAGASEEVKSLQLLEAIYGEKATSKHREMVAAIATQRNGIEEYLHALKLLKTSSPSKASREMKKHREGLLSAALCAVSPETGRPGVALYAELKALLFGGVSYEKKNKARGKARTAAMGSVDE